jgi:hypothetical protein
MPGVLPRSDRYQQSRRKFEDEAAYPDEKLQDEIDRRDQAMKNVEGEEAPIWNRNNVVRDDLSAAKDAKFERGLRRFFRRLVGSD